jgi:branched-chain amino acid transport system ATP-binding protein
MSDNQISARADAPGATVLALEGIRVRFGGITAVDGVDLRVAPNEICGVIGPNGAGKTTLFDVIAGVRKPDEGKIFLDGSDMTKATSVAMARFGIRRTFQRIQTYGWLSVEDNVLAALDWRGGGGGVVADLFRLPSRRRIERQRRDQVEEVLRACGLWEIREQRVCDLPLGRARMVEFARAIVDPPKLLLFDEPTSGLDAADAEIMGEHIERLHKSETCAILLVEHNVSFVLRYAPRIVVLDLGKVLADGTPEEIQSDPAVLAAYFSGAVA